MENIFFLVLVALVGLIRWLYQAAETRKNAEAARRAGTAQPRAQPTSIPRAPAQTEEERIRRFMEALGVPTSSSPPPRVQPRQLVPTPEPAKRKILPVDPFPIPRATRLPQQPLAEVPVPPVIALPEPLPRLPMPSRSAPARSAFEVQDIDAEVAEDLVSNAGKARVQSSSQAARAEASFIARLGNVEGLRDAMLLREIFGPPRSMQGLDAR